MGISKTERGEEIEMTYRMRITTETANGKTRTETVQHIPADQLESRRQAVRDGQPRGSVFGVKVIKER